MMTLPVFSASFPSHRGMKRRIRDFCILHCAVCIVPAAAAGGLADLYAGEVRFGEDGRALLQIITLHGDNQIPAAEGGWVITLE